MLIQGWANHAARRGQSAILPPGAWRQSSPLRGVCQDVQKALHLTQVLFSVWDREGPLRHVPGVSPRHPQTCCAPAPAAPSFLSILLIMRRRGSMYLDSCFSLSRYCCSSAWLEPAGLMTELGFTGGYDVVSVAPTYKPGLCKPSRWGSRAHPPCYKQRPPDGEGRISAP